MFRFRYLIQPISAIFFNLPFLAPCLRQVPVPVFNCYACPLASGACPIGTIQHFFVLKILPVYTIGVLGFIGALSGRFSCGFLCPFGYFQDWIYKIKSKKLFLPHKHFLTYIKYLSLLILVIIIPYITGEPWFSKLCPLGMIQAGIPLTIFDQSLQSLIGPLFYLKIIILVAVVVAGIVIERFWCRVICPLGAIFGLFNSTSLVKMKVNQQNCNDCGVCIKICPAHIDIHKEANSPECIRCLKCTSTCKNITLNLY